LPSSPFFTGRKKLVYVQGNAQRWNEAPTCRLRGGNIVVAPSCTTCPLDT
jgi:hypothetical protein